MHLKDLDFVFKHMISGILLDAIPVSSVTRIQYRERKSGVSLGG